MFLERVPRYFPKFGEKEKERDFLSPRRRSFPAHPQKERGMGGLEGGGRTPLPVGEACGGVFWGDMKKGIGRKRKDNTDHLRRKREDNLPLA